MSPALTRRGFAKAGAAALGASAMGIPIAAQAAADPDAELFSLLAQEANARAVWRAASDALDAASDREMRSRPHRPDALRSGLGDHVLDLGAAAGCKAKLRSGGYRVFWDDKDVEQLRQAPLPTRWALGHPDDPPRREPDPDGEARRREIIAAYDAWRADRRAVEDAVGLTAATIADHEAGRALTVAEDAIQAYRARTIQGLAAKAAWVADRLSDEVTETTLGEEFAREVAAFGRDAA